ncbi:MAG TPA: PspC domain-containing protein [Candidatus Saccharibacteria bacterium]|nr:PspC domain-containing protein [Candidatus Saccharibacteria bacterium]
MAEKNKTLYRIPKKGQLFGVCAGLSDYFEIDVVLVRIIFIILIFATSGAMIFIYLLMAVILPVKNYDVDQYNTVEERVSAMGKELIDNKVINRTRNYIGLGLLIIGIWMLINQIFPNLLILKWNYVWPVLIILAGLMIIIRRDDERKK